MSCKPCTYCGQPVVFRLLRTGQTRPFDREMHTAEHLGERARWVPTAVSGTVVMVPAADLSPQRLAKVRWFATQHTCAESLRARRERLDPAGLADVAGELATILGNAKQAAE